MVIKYMKGGLPDCTEDLISKNTPCKLGKGGVPKKSKLESLGIPPSGSPYKATPAGYTPTPAAYTPPQSEPYYPPSPPQSVELATEAPRVAPREVYAEPLPGPYDEPLYDTPAAE